MVLSNYVIIVVEESIRVLPKELRLIYKIWSLIAVLKKIEKNIVICTKDS